MEEKLKSEGFDVNTIKEAFVVLEEEIDALVHKNILEKEKKPLSDEEILKKIAEILLDTEKDKILNHLSISIEIKKNVFGKWGIIHWDEVNPKGTREKIYLILKENLILF